MATDKPRVILATSQFNPYGPAKDELVKTCEVVHANRDEIWKEEDLTFRLLGDNIEGIIAGAEEPYTKEVFNCAPRLKVISRLGVGTDNIDLDAAKDRNIKVFITPEATTDAVAEHTVALLLALTKRLSMPGREPGMRLRGKMVGIIGLGRIGTRVGTILSTFGCNIMFYDPNVPVMHPSWYRAEDIDKLLYMSDIVTLHAPGQKTPIIGQKEINTCKKGAFIINTARSSLIDERALCAGLDLGYIAGAGLDVVEKPQLFGRFPQVVITPHTASYTVESQNEMEIAAVRNLIKGLDVT